MKKIVLVLSLMVSTTIFAKEKTPSFQNPPKRGIATSGAQIGSSTAKADDDICNGSYYGGWSQAKDLLQMLAKNKIGKDAASLAEYASGALKSDPIYTVGQVLFETKRGKTGQPAPNDFMCYPHKIIINVNYDKGEDESTSECTILINEKSKVTTVTCEMIAG